jgi:LCP family protein required for cell wall assembly
VPDDRPDHGTGPRSDDGSAHGRPSRHKRRRSMDTYGGISVSEVMARSTGEHAIPSAADIAAAKPPAARPPAPKANAPRPPAPRTPVPPKAPVRRPVAPPQAPPVPPVPPAARQPAKPPQSGSHALPEDRQPRLRQPRRAAPEMPVADLPTRRRPPVPADVPAPPQAPKAPPVPPVAKASQASQPAQVPRTQQPPRPPRRPAPAVAVPPRAELDPLTMTDQMEAIDDATAVRHKIDNTLARFSAAHDEMNAEEDERKKRRERLAARPAALLDQTRTALQRVIATSPEPDAAAKPEAEKAPQTRLQEKKQRRSDRSILITRIATAVLAAIVLIGTGAAWGTKSWYDSQFNKVAALDENSTDIQNAAGQTGDENFLMVGSDTRDGAKAEDGVGDATEAPGARSDTIMIAHIPADRQRVVMVSFPRDLEIARPECNRWDPITSQYSNEKSPSQKIAKLNTAYAVGGPQCVTKVIQQITGMKMTHFVGIDFNGFKEMVDAVEGVTVHTDIPIDDTVLGKVIPQAGDIRITGDQALNFVRARHVKGDVTSDYGRIKRQQEFIGSLLKAVMSKEVMLNAGRITGFVTAFAKATFGDNLGVDQMLTLAQSMRGLSADKINFLTVPTTGNANTRGNEVLVPTKANGIFRALIENVALPDDKAAAPPPSTSAAPPSSSTKSTGSKKSTSSSSNG